MHEMRPVAIGDPVAQCVCVSVTRQRAAKTAERMSVLFGVEIHDDPRHIVLNWGPDHRNKEYLII